MKVQNISQNSQVFEKRRFINAQMRSDLEVLLERMNSEVVTESGEYRFKSTMTKKLESGKAFLIDGRIFLNKVPLDKQMQHETMITIGKTELVIDNATGEIIDHHKPFYITWQSALKKLAKYLTLFKEQYNNPQIVTKKTLSIAGFTEKGIEMFRKISTTK